MKENNAMPKFIVDEELHGLLVTLRDSKEVYIRICTRIRKQGVRLGEDEEKDYNQCIDELIDSASCIICGQLIHDISDIQKGGLL